MIKAVKIVKLAPMAKDLAVGAGVWSLLLSAEPSGAIDVERVGLGFIWAVMSQH